MAKPAAPRSNFLVVFLWMTTMLLAYNLFFNKPKPAATAAQGDLLKVMREQNAKMLDVSIVGTKSTYDGTVDERAKSKAITPAQAEAQKIESAVLVAETQYRAGIARNDTSRIRNAYNTLWPYEKRLLDRPEWKGTPVPVVGGRAVTGQGLFDEIGVRLTERNKGELIWGFLPGGYTFIDTLVAITGRTPALSYWFAALLLAFVVRLIVFPFSQKQLMFSRQMSQLSPLVTEVKEQYKDDPQQQQLKTMGLYKEYGINPMAGCAPALVQMPLFLTVYQCMLLYQFEFQKGTFAWINPGLSKSTGGFVAANLGQQDAILIILYGISMVISTLLTPVNDPSQLRQQRLLGVGVAVVFTFFMFTGAFPVVAGFVLYWTFTNVFSTLQSLRAYRLPLPPLKKVNAAGGGVIPVDPLTLRTSTATNGNGKTGKPVQHRPKKRSK